FDSGRPLTYIHSAEEERVARVLCEVATQMAVPVWTWSATEGMRAGGVGQALSPANPKAGNTESPRAALDFILAYSGAGIFHLKDFPEPLRESPEVRRRLRDVHEQCLDRGKFVVITSAVRFVPEEVERSILFLDLRPPDQAELVEFLRDEAARHAGE